MRAITVPVPGGPSALVVSEVAEPVPGPREVVIDVAAAGVNRADVNQREGHYPSPAGAPSWPGLEVSGTVVATGEHVTAAAVGDYVVALLPGGGYADRVQVDEGLVLPLPRGVDLVEAAGLPEAVATVWSNVFMSAGLAPGETLLVHGGSSGVGSIAIQMAVALGSTVYATAGSADKTSFCEQLGATRGIDYKTEDFVAVVQELTDGRGVDVVLDLVGGDYLARDVEALALGGRVVFIGNQSGAQGSLDIGTLMRKRAAVHATTLRARPLEERRAIIGAVRENVWPLVADGTVRPVVDEVIPLADAERAHERMTASGHIGKLLLTP